MKRAILFDFDGVVIDSESLHEKTKAIVLDHHHIPYPAELFDLFKGQPEDAFFQYVSKKLDPLHRPPEDFRAQRQGYLAKHLPEMPLIDGFREFIDEVKRKGLLSALVTSSSTQEIRNIDQYLNFVPLFDEIVTAEATNQHKPHPAPYLKALDILKLEPDQCIVLEDAPNGIIAGKRAGCTVCALTTSFTREEIQEAGADMIFEGFKQLRVLLEDF